MKAGKLNLEVVAIESTRRNAQCQPLRIDVATLSKKQRRRLDPLWID